MLNANWLRHRLRGAYDLPYDRPNMHEFVASTTGLKKADGAAGPRRRQAPAGGGLPRPDGLLPADRRRGAHDRADRDGEPPDAVAALADALLTIAAGEPEVRPWRPRTTPVGRVDEARAARMLLPTWDAVLAKESR